MTLSRFRSFVFAGGLVVSGVALMGCPDPEGQYDAFLAATEDMRLSGDTSTGSGVFADFSGDFLLALSTSLAPGVPLYFLASVTVDAEESTIDIDFQPLSVDSADPPRSPVGDLIVVTDIPYEEDGTFVADLGTVEAPGEANPLTGRDSVANLILNGRVDSETFFCGSVEGALIEPAEFDLAGSTFGAEAAGLDDVNDITEVIFECPEPSEGTGGSAE